MYCPLGHAVSHDLPLRVSSLTHWVHVLAVQKS